MRTKLVRENILHIVEQFPECANEDRKLITKYWQHEGLDLDDEQIYKILRLTTPETITRERRRLVKDNLIQTSKEAKNRRGKREIEYVQEYSAPKTIFVGNTAYIE